MYRHVHIRSPVAQRSLDERISSLSEARGMNIWRWVDTLFVDADQDIQNIMVLPMRTVNLINVNIYTPVSPELLVVLRESCPLLRSLEISVDTETHEAMAHVGLFQQIKHLGITTLRPISIWNRSIDPLKALPSWNMPAVTSFWWGDLWTKPAHEAAFMSRCRFPHLTHLDILLANHAADHDGIPHVCRLLDAHRDIRSLRIEVRDTWYASIVRTPTYVIRCLSEAGSKRPKPSARFQAQNVRILTGIRPPERSKPSA
jgi:hypothetical protein